MLATASAALLSVMLPTAAYAATWSSTAQYGSWSNGGYTLNNDVWGSGAGPQTIWANSYSNWGVWSEQPNTGGVKSYPNAAYPFSQQLSSLSSVTSNFNITMPSGSQTDEAAYDIWLGNNAYEVMLWMDNNGSKPISYNWDSNGNPIPVASNVYIGGYTWNVYKGTNGSNQTFSFVVTNNTTSGTVNVLSVLNWINGQGWYSNPVLNSVQFGFEITSSPSGLNFTVNSYGVSYTTGSSGGSSGYVRFQNRSTGMYIDGMGYTSNGSNACQWSNSNSNNQQWTIVPDGSYVLIQNRASGLYLDGMGNTGNGSAVGQWSYSNSNNQQWSEQSDGSYVRFQNRATGLYIDGMGSTSNGAVLAQWSNSNSNNQQWSVQSD